MNKFAYVGLGFLVFIGFLLVMAPANNLFRLIEADFSRQLPDTTLTAIEGSIWQGSGDLYYRQLPAIEVSWTLSALALLTGAADIEAHLGAAGLDLSLEANADSEGGEVRDLSGSVSSEFLNPMTVPYGLELSGDIQVTRGTVTFDHTWLTAAEAELTWSGGIVHIQTPERVHTTRLPQIRGSVSMAGRNLVIDVTGNDEDLMKIIVKPDGWAEVRVAYAFADLANIPLPGSETTKDRSLPAITLEEKIL